MNTIARFPKPYSLLEKEFSLKELTQELELQVLAEEFKWLTSQHTEKEQDIVETPLKRPHLRLKIYK